MEVVMTSETEDATLIGFKLFRRRKDGSLGPLFINARQVITVGEWLPAGCYPTKGFAVRPGWHICSEKNAPHLSKKGRVWCEVEFRDAEEHRRPEVQGGLWYTAKQMKILKVFPLEG
jgi:hypothetical protein